MRVRYILQFDALFLAVMGEPWSIGERFRSHYERSWFGAYTLEQGALPICVPLDTGVVNGYLSMFGWY